MTDIPRFRVTVWPNDPIPERALFRPVARLGPRGGLTVGPEYHESSYLPPELFLRELRDLDMSAPAGVVAFIDEYGADEFWNATVAQVVESLERVRWLVDHWNAHLRGVSFPPVSWVRFHAELNTLLEAFHARCEVFFPDGSFLSDAPFLSSAIALQLWNFMAEEGVVRRCQNCGRDFYRQLGRAEKGQYRTTGVKFCRTKCASAFASRESRRKAKQRKDPR